MDTVVYAIAMQIWPFGNFVFRFWLNPMYHDRPYGYTFYAVNLWATDYRNGQFSHVSREDKKRFLATASAVGLPYL